MPCGHRRPFRSAPVACVLVSASFLLGCAAPNKVNIALRKREQELSSKLDALERQHQADTQIIRGLRERTGTQQTLTPDRLEQLFTTHGLKLGRLSGGADLQPDQPGDEALKIHLVPTDETAQPLKAAGAFTIDAYDFSLGDKPRIGHWEFDLQQTRQAWRGALMDYTYVLTCPWQTPPRSSRVHVEITFLDALAQTPFHKSADLQVNPPGPLTQPSAQPTSNPATH